MPSAPISTSPLRGRDVRAVAVEEIGGDAAIVLREAAEPVAEVEAALAEPRARRLIDHALQLAAMDRELRHVVAGIEPARLAPDLLAEAVQVEQLVGADRDRVEPLQQPELLQLLDGVRQRVDADPELADAVGLLIDLAVDAARMQHQGGGQPAHASADDDRLHALNATTIAHVLVANRSTFAGHAHAAAIWPTREPVINRLAAIRLAAFTTLR